MGEPVRFFKKRPVIPGEFAHFWHDASAAWTRTVASFGDFTENSTPAVFTKLEAVGMSIKTAAANLPGFRFTPSAIDAVYEIRLVATMQQSGDGDNRAGILQLWNGTAGAEIAQSSPVYAQSGGIFLAGQPINAFFAPRTLSEVEVRLRGYSSSAGAGLILGYIGHAVEWTIRRIR